MCCERWGAEASQRADYEPEIPSLNPSLDQVSWAGGGAVRSFRAISCDWQPASSRCPSNQFREIRFDEKQILHPFAFSTWSVLKLRSVNKEMPNKFQVC